jgi:NDP-sugar pyrophosphorylase family protein
MSVIALLMAGGRSERMRAGGDATHKALRRVCGVTLLEHNVVSVLAANVGHVAIAISASEAELRRGVVDIAEPLCRAVGTPCEIVVEERALGNIGAAKLVAGAADHVLVLYVDNLTSLDLRDFLTSHIAGGRAATIATHVETFVDPYGELTIVDDEVIGYAEKPVRRVTVSSGTCALTSAACSAIPDGVPTAAHELFALLRSRGWSVGAYRHDAPWVDVNDEASILRAERIIYDRT